MELYQLVLGIVILILFYNFSNSNEKKNDLITTQNIKKKNNKSSKLDSKKVTFDLDKNTVYEIDDKDKNMEHVKNYFYGNNIMNDNEKNENLIKNVDTNRSQERMIKRLNEKNPNDDIFKNTKSYWNNLNIGDFTEREYLNNQVNEINIFKNNNNNFKNMEISKVYDELTKGDTSQHEFIYNDNDINENIIDGYSYNCNFERLDNIEN